MKLKKFDQFNESINQTKFSFTKQTMKMNINWFAAKDFDVCYLYENVSYRTLNNDENGYNFLFGRYGTKLANINKYIFLKKDEIEKIYNYANKYGGNPKPIAFTISKGTKLKVTVEEFNYLTVKILDGIYVDKEFRTSLLDFRTYLIGYSNEDLIVSKYRIFLNGKPLKTKYYTNIGRIKLALLSAFGLLETEAEDDDSEVPYYIDNSHDTALNKEDCKNVQIMRYDNNSKTPVLVDFDVLKFYEDSVANKELKKDIKKYNL